MTKKKWQQSKIISNVYDEKLMEMGFLPGTIIKYRQSAGLYIVNINNSLIAMSKEYMNKMELRDIK